MLIVETYWCQQSSKEANYINGHKMIELFIWKLWEHVCTFFRMKVFSWWVKSLDFFGLIRKYLTMAANRTCWILLWQCTLLWCWLFFSEHQCCNMSYAVIIFIINNYVDISHNQCWKVRFLKLLKCRYSSHVCFIYAYQINTSLLMCSLMTLKIHFMFGYFTLLGFSFVLFSTLTLLKAMNYA